MQGNEPSLNRRMFLRGAAGVLGAVAAPGLLAACTRNDAQSEASPAADPDPGTAPENLDFEAPDGGGSADGLRVGLLVPTSGVYTTLGSAMVQGFNLFVGENLDAFGGRRIETVTVDEGETPESGVEAAQRLLNEEQVDLVVGIVSSGVALNVRDLFDQGQVPLIIANAGAGALTGQARSPYLFRTSFSNAQEGYALGQYMYDNVTEQGVYLIGPDYAAGIEHLVGFRKAYEEAGGVVLRESHPAFATTEDYTPFLDEIKEIDAEAVWAFFSGAEAVRFVQQYAEAGLQDDVPLLGTPLTDENWIEAQGDAAEGVRSSLHYALDLDLDRNRQFVSAYQAAYGVMPSSFSVQAYDAAQLLALGLQATEGDTSNMEAFIEAMASIEEIDSPRGAFTLDGNRNPVQSFYLRTVEDGEIVYTEDLGVVADPLN
ncbi:MAG: ABC transporter substrate-binding protein [Nitriliruptorales bacterium]|nr:ABC transporter substrate-binding protein [Nitriliruptorales bacterium]